MTSWVSRKIHLYIFILFISIILIGCSNSTANNPEGLTEAKVSRVIDGDTVEVELENGNTEKVRLILVDTPESKGKYAGNPQPFGRDAEEFTKKHLQGKTIGLELGVSERDPFGRLLVYIWVDGSMFNETLLKEGLARVAVYPPNTKYLDQFREIEEQAKQSAKNIWSIENYVQKEGYEESVEGPSESPSEESDYDQANELEPDKDCGDFSTWEEAQAFFESAGTNDPHRLDGDGDGIACDSIK